MATTTQKAKSTRSSSARASASRQGGKAKTTATTSKSTTATTARRSPQTATVNLPFVTAQFRRPEVHLPEFGRENVTGAVNAVREKLPPREQMAYFAGLGLLAALSVIEWPVAAAIGVGSVIAQRSAGEHSAKAS